MKKTREEILETLDKLLALSTSSNEFEAQSALMKAQKIMAEYKISQDELGNNRKDEKIEWRYTVTTYSNRRDFWIESLAVTIAKNFCCKMCRGNGGYRSQTYTVVFVGFESDTEMCEKAFNYALSFIQEHITQEIAKPMMKQLKVDYRTRRINDIANSYALGFTHGLDWNFKEQMKNVAEKGKTYAMVMTVPKEVEEDFSQNTRKTEYHHPTGLDRLSYSEYNRGYEEGKKFDVNRKFVAAAC